MSSSDFSRFGFPFDPWRDMTRLADDDMHADIGQGGFRAAQPPVHVYAGTDDLLLTIDIPGVDSETVDIIVQGDVLTIRGARLDTAPDGVRRTLRRERPRGGFQRQVRLPFDVEGTDVAARVRDGVLYLTLPKSDGLRTRYIDVEAE